MIYFLFSLSLFFSVGPTDIQCTRSDRGTCVCGECICRTNAQVYNVCVYIQTLHAQPICSCLVVALASMFTQGEPLFYGPACECDDSRCGRFNDLLCSGRGTCTCNGCVCNVEPTTNMPYYSGSANACECTPATNCIDPRNNTVR